MRPKPRSAMPGTNAAHSWKAASTLTAWIRRQVSRLSSPNGRKSISPAQLTSTSHRGDGLVRGMQVTQRQRVPRRGQPQCNGLTDPAGRTRHDRDAPGRPGHAASVTER